MGPGRIRQLLEFLEKEPDDTFLNYALALEYQKDAATIDRAQQLFEMIIRKDENYLAAYYQLGKLFEVKGEISAAISTLKAGHQKAIIQKNRKAAGEFEEAIFMLED
jgi:lipopolysaccharide biosynthesis regulator YciM